MCRSPEVELKEDVNKDADVNKVHMGQLHRLAYCLLPEEGVRIHHLQTLID